MYKACFGVCELVIQQIEGYSVALRYKEPFRIAPGASTESHNIVVKDSRMTRLLGGGNHRLRKG